jgi:hypothetical protein
MINSPKATVESTEPKSKSAKPSPAESEALRLLQSPFFFNQYLAAVEKAGLVGEWRNALALFIVAVSRLLGRPLCAFVKGPSSSGKNCLVGKVLSLMPRGRVRELSNASDKALHYSKDHFRHRVLFLQERDEAAGTIHPLRLLISENKLIRIVTSFVNGQRVAEKHMVRGPVAAISTTTKSGLRIDDETRHLSLFVNQSSEQTRQIVQGYTKGNQLSEQDLETWHAVQRLIERRAANLRIVFSPFFNLVTENVFVEDVSVRRYFPTFVEACRTICLIRSFQRERQPTEAGEIQVEFADFAIAALIFERIFVESLHRQEGSALEVRQAVKEISASKNNTTVQAEDLAAKLGIPLHSAYQRLREATRAGTVRQVNRPQKNNPKFYLPAQRPRFLPDPKELFQMLNSAERRIQFVHPITGEWITYSRRVRKQQAFAIYGF